MKIGIVGGGVVGQATAAAFRGHADEVRVYDTDPSRTTHTMTRVTCCDVVFVCVPETAVEALFRDQINANRSSNYVLRSTVPVGTTRRLAERYGLPNLVHSPEFLTERTATEDAANPRLLVIGSKTGKLADYDVRTPLSSNPVVLHNLYAQRWPEVPIIHMSSDESELVKLATNAFFATKVSFWNEVESYCRAAGVDYETVRAACVAEGRVGDLHTHCPGHHGYGFAGKCLPKDLRQLIACLTDAGTPAPVMCSVQDRNEKIDRLRS